jgi:hypothetical protein
MDAFGELLTTSDMVVNNKVTWITFHRFYFALGIILKLFSTKLLKKIGRKLLLKNSIKTKKK